MEKHYHGHRDRLKEKFRQNPASLYDYEIVELLLTFVNRRSDVKPQAKAILDKAGSIADVLSTPLDDVPGVGPQTGFLFEIIREFLVRQEHQKVKTAEITLNNPEVVFSYLKHLIGSGAKEQFVVLFLNSKNQLISSSILSKGTVNAAAVYPREIVEEALKQRASAVIISHNHPSGEITPSKDDIAITDKIKKALQTVEIPLLDHIIVSTKAYFSFRKDRKI